jgi:hypothetical protein
MCRCEIWIQSQSVVAVPACSFRCFCVPRGIKFFNIGLSDQGICLCKIAITIDRFLEGRDRVIDILSLIRPVEMTNAANVRIHRGTILGQRNWSHVVGVVFQLQFQCAQDRVDDSVLHDEGIGQ